MGYMRDYKARRLDSFDPPRDLPAVIGWWDTSTLAATNGTAVGTLHDLSGHGSDLIQDVAANRPTVAAAALGGRKVLTFGATAAMISSAFGNSNGFQPAGWAQPNTAVLLAKVASTTTGTRCLVGGGSSAGRQNILMASTGAINLFAGNTYAGGGRSYADDAWHVFAAVFDTVSARIYVDGTLTSIVLSQAHGAESWSTLGLFATSGGATNVVGGGQVAELIACNARLSSGQIGSLTAALATKWGLA